MQDFFQGFHIKLIDYFKDIFQEIFVHPQWFIMRRLARFEVIRRWKTASFNTYNPDIEISNKLSIFTNINIENAVADLEKHGLYQGLQLPEYIIEDILKFAYNTRCYAAKNPKLGFFVHEKDKAQTACKQKILVGKYFNTASQCQAIYTLQNDPVLIKIAAKYLKTKPVHISNSLFWSFPANANFFEQSKAAQVFHCDLDDYKFIKFFFYLTDVDTKSGSHIYILGSHNRKKFLYQLLRGRATEQDLIDYYGKENIVPITGPRGWGFAEDTFGYHKGTLPITKPRLMLQVEFAAKDYGTQHDFVEPAHLKSIL
ncbi:MAG: hypothetical protein IGS39_09020 [Calothrix sp. C42_A2020_038]|nr:hypothetical protein [Calothrix sp. C42_A2020_038]